MTPDLHLYATVALHMLTGGWWLWLPGLVVLVREGVREGRRGA